MDPFYHLPDELIVEQLLAMDIETLRNYCRTSHRVRVICSDSRLWDELIERDFDQLLPWVNLPTGLSSEQLYRWLEEVYLVPLSTFRIRQVPGPIGYRISKEQIGQLAIIPIDRTQMANSIANVLRERQGAVLILYDNDNRRMVADLFSKPPNSSMYLRMKTQEYFDWSQVRSAEVRVTYYRLPGMHYTKLFRLS